MSAELLEIPIVDIKPAKDNIRDKIGDVAELAESIASHGLVEPVVATRENGHYVLVAGERRLAGAKKAGLKTVPTIVRDYDEEQRVEVMLIENLQREGLTALEEARAYRRLLDLGHTQRELAKRIGRSQPHISKRIALLELPAEVTAKVDSGGITIGGALELAKLADAPAALTAALEELNGYPGTIVEEDAAEVVEAELRQLEGQKRIAAKRAELEAKGVQLLEVDSRTLRAPKGTMRIAKEGGWDTLKIDPAKHAKEPCHAAIIHPDPWSKTVRVEYLCTDRKRHPNLKTESEGSRSRATTQSSKRREHEKELGVARTERRSFIGTLVNRRLAKGEAVGLIVDALLDRGEADAEKIACQLLELEPTKHRYGGLDHEAPLRELAGKNAASKLKVGIALALATSENRLSHSWWNSWGKDGKAHFDYLERHGFKPSSAEKLELAGKAPKGQ